MGGRGTVGKSSTTLSKRESDAAEYYVSGEGMWINQYLRGRGDFGELSTSEKTFIKDLDDATNRKVGERTLYRSTDAEAIFGKRGTGDYENLATIINYGPDAFGSGSYANSIKDKIEGLIKNTIGKTITEKGFMSTTKSEKVAAEFQDFTGSSRPVVLKIKTNVGTKGVDLSKFDKNALPGTEQEEVLLHRGQSYRVNKIYSKNRQIYIDVEMR